MDEFQIQNIADDSQFYHRTSLTEECISISPIAVDANIRVIHDQYPKKSTQTHPIIYIIDGF